MNSTTNPNQSGRGRGERRVVLAEDITDEELALIEAAEVPAEYAYLDEEMKASDSQP